MKTTICIILFVVVLLPSTSFSAPFVFDAWDKQDIGLEATYLVLHFVDWRQTLSIVDQPDKYHEVNPLLGRHPSRNTVNFYMIGTSLIHVGIVHILPKKWRPHFQGTTIGISAICIGNNFVIGLRMAL